MKNLIIDGQILQTNAWFRGMGKYTLRVLHELSANLSEGMQVSLIFNSTIETDQSRFETINFLCPNINQLQWELPLASDKNNDEEDYANQLNINVEDNFSNLENYYLLTSLFSFEFFASFPANSHKLILFYDLTPLLFWKDLGGFFPPDLYMPRFQRLFEAELIFCISGTTRNDLANIFGLNPNRLANINGGFTKIAEITKKPSGFKVPKKYILFPTGDLPHKNNDVAIKGYEQYILNNTDNLPILITSNFQGESRNRLSLISEKIIFTGNVADEELEWLYENAEAVLFASKYEGLGMPVLDAVANGKPIIASRIPVFEEMSSNAFYYFDANKPNDLANAFVGAQKRADFNKKLKEYPNIMKKYTWGKTGQAVFKALSDSKFKGDIRVANNSKPTIAVACLHPGVKGQIGRFVEPMHYSLSQKFNISYYFDANGLHYTDMERPTFLDHVDTKTFDIAKLDIRDYKKYDSVIYFIDKTSIPSRVAQRAVILPGVMLLGSTTGLDGQNELFKDLIIENQYSCFVVDEYSQDYNGYQTIIADLYKAITKQVKQKNAAEIIIRNGNSNARIIKKLKELTS